MASAWTGMNTFRDVCRTEFFLKKICNKKSLISGQPVLRSGAFQDGQTM